MQQGTLQPRGFHALVYGPPGVLKTTLCCQAPKPLLLLDWEVGSGWLDLNVDGITVKHPSTGDSPTDATFQALLDASRTGRYATIVVDSLTNIRARELDKLSGGGMPEQGHYGLFQAWLASTLMASQYFPQIILWTAGYEEKQDGIRRVIVPGGFSDNNLITINQNLDALVYAGYRQKPSGAVTRYLTTEAQEPFGGRSAIMVKDRTGLLPGTMEMPSPEKKSDPIPEMANMFFGNVFNRVLRAAASAPTTGTRPAVSATAAPSRPPAAPVGATRPANRPTTTK